MTFGRSPAASADATAPTLASRCAPRSARPPTRSSRSSATYGAPSSTRRTTSCSPTTAPRRRATSSPDLVGTLAPARSSPPAPTAATRCSPTRRPGSTCRSSPTATDARRDGETVRRLTRVRWGGSLLEWATRRRAPVKLLTVAHHAVDARAGRRRRRRRAPSFTPTIDPPLAAHDRARPRRARGGRHPRRPRRSWSAVAAASASPEGFAPLEELAAVLGGVVGCSRAVTNNGWRNHTDQVGQTGTRIAPDVYFACGISGAIQHWVGAIGVEVHHRDQHRPRREHGHQGRLRGDRRPARGRPGDLGRDPPSGAGIA